MKYKYGGYIRKSSEAKEKQALSIASQKEAIKNKFPDFDIVWFEESRSAFEPNNRPEFVRMLNMALNDELHGIIAWHPDRLSRNEKEAGDITYSIRKNLIKDLKFVSYTFENTPDGIKHLQNSLSDSQYYSSKLGVDVKRGLGDKLTMGRMPCLAPVGYFNTKLATRGENKIMEDLERFPLVRKMWDLLLTGNYSVPQVRDIATNEWGLLTPKKKKVGGGKIGYTSAYGMFTNMFYTGYFMYKGKMYKGDHKPMITMAEFDRVQTLLKEHGKPRAKTHEFAYGCGTFTCGECNRSFVGIEKIKFIKSTKETKVYVFYLCGHKKSVVYCSQKYNINETKVEEQIEAEIQKYTIDSDFLNWTLEVMKDNNVLETVTEKDVKENILKTIETKQEELKKLIQMATKGFVSDEEFRESRTELDKTINNLKTQLNEVEGDKNENLMELTEKAFYYSTYALIALKNGDKRTRKEIIKSLGMNREIKDKIVNIKAFEWYFHIQKAYSSLREQLAGTEPEIRCEQRSISDFSTLRSLLRSLRDMKQFARLRFSYLQIPRQIQPQETRP